MSPINSLSTFKPKNQLKQINIVWFKCFQAGNGGGASSEKFRDFGQFSESTDGWLYPKLC